MSAPGPFNFHRYQRRARGGGWQTRMENIVAASWDTDMLHGWNTAQLTLVGQQAELTDWYENGVGRGISIFAGTAQVWQGFVNQVTLTIGGEQIVVGPLTEIGNRVVVIYTPVFSSEYEPITGTQLETTAAQDTTSQGIFSTWDKVYSAGSLEEDGTPPLAEQIRDTLLGDIAYPKVSPVLYPTGGDSPQVVLDCVGNWGWFLAYVYNEDAWLTRTITAQIQHVSSAAHDPNDFFSTNYMRMTANGALVARFERDNAIAWDVVQGLVASGDPTNYTRWRFGVYEDGVLEHQPVSTTPAYQYQLKDPTRRITAYGGRGSLEVSPWDVKPGRWLFVPDLILGRDSYTSNRRDPRMLLIERVGFTMPDQLEINGTPLMKLPQLLAQQAMLGGGQ